MFNSFKKSQHKKKIKQQQQKKKKKCNKCVCGLQDELDIFFTKHVKITFLKMILNLKFQDKPKWQLL